MYKAASNCYSIQRISVFFPLPYSPCPPIPPPPLNRYPPLIQSNLKHQQYPHSLTSSPPFPPSNYLDPLDHTAKEYSVLLLRFHESQRAVIYVLNYRCVSHSNWAALLVPREPGLGGEQNEGMREY